MKLINAIKNNKLWIVLILVAALIRILLGQLVGCWLYSEAGADGGLMIKYSFLGDHFRNPDYFSLVKTLSFPFLLFINRMLQIQYPITLSIIWIIAALFTFYISYKILKKKWFSYLIFLYCLFLPCAFEKLCGTEIYRNAIIAPCITIMFSTLILTIYYLIVKKNLKRSIVWMIVFTITFIFNYYIKEDGVWMLALYLGIIFILLAILVFNVIKKKPIRLNYIIKCTVIVIVPLATFFLATTIYKEVNYKFFGVREIQTRTEAELGNFVNRIYKIDSNNQTTKFWAPVDSIEKAFNSSNTLKQHPELLYDIKHTGWRGHDIVAYPINGDILGWIMRSSLRDTGLWQNERQVNDFFHTVNQELDEAFDNGSLKATNKIQIIGSAVGRTPEEIVKLLDVVAAGYRGVILLEDYVPGMMQSSLGSMDIAIKGANTTKLDYLTRSEPRFEQNSVNKGLEVLFTVYKNINLLLCIIFIANIVLPLVFYLKKYINKTNMKKCLLLTAISIFFLAMSFVYTFCISWFSEFLEPVNVALAGILNHYNVASISMMMFVYIFSSCSLMNCFLHIKKKQAKRTKLNNRK